MLEIRDMVKRLWFLFEGDTQDDMQNWQGAGPVYDDKCDISDIMIAFLDTLRVRLSPQSHSYPTVGFIVVLCEVFVGKYLDL